MQRCNKPLKEINFRQYRENQTLKKKKKSSEKACHYDIHTENEHINIFFLHFDYFDKTQIRSSEQEEKTGEEYINFYLIYLFSLV